MKKENLDRANTICKDIERFDLVNKIVGAATCKVTVSVECQGYGDRRVAIPKEHSDFLKRVIKDHYQGLLDKLMAELEGL